MPPSPAVLRKSNGVLSGGPAMAPSQTAGSQPPKVAKTKVPVQGQKVAIRRLAPGLTEEEFVSYLPDEWKPGNGRIGWFCYQPGKVSNDAAKPSRPSRAYLHVLKSETAEALWELVRTTEWEDARETSDSSCLVGPPVAEFSVYKKVPSSKVRVDARQGTIDQDPEFMDFLEALANPAPTKDPEADNTAEDEEKLPAKVSSTPLIDYLREKKANKAKEAASAKAAKHSRHESQTAKGKGSDEPKKKSKDGKADKPERPRETVKILTKKAATDAAAQAANAVASQITAATSNEDSSRSRRAGIAAAARILQRDLGLSPGNAHRMARQEAAKAGSEATKATSPASTATGAPSSGATKDSAKTAAASAAEGAANAPPPPTPTAPKAVAVGSTRGSRGKKASAAGETQKTRDKKGGSTDKGGETSSTAPPKTPVTILKKKEDPAPASAPSPPAKPVTAPAAASTKAAPSGPKSSQGGKGASVVSASQKKGAGASSPAVSPNATRAFVKHANPSQGVTEALLKEAMLAFGRVSFVEIDRRKGFAYVDFADHDSLVKAISASPVSVAQAAVQVLERKETGKKAGALAAGASSAAASGEGGGKSGGKGGGGAAAAQSQPTPKPAAAPKAEPTNTGSGSTPPSGPAADKARSAEHKRGGRRRGGRGRGGDGQPKDDSGGGNNTNNNAPSAPSTPA